MINTSCDSTSPPPRPTCKGSLTISSNNDCHKLFENGWSFITVNNGLCNGIYDTSTLSRNPCLRSIVIGNNCFSYTNSFLIESVPFLESIVVGNNSFTKHKEDCPSESNDKTRSLRINHCPHLKEFIVGLYSFNDYAGGLNLTSLMNSVLSHLRSSSFTNYHN